MSNGEQRIYGFTGDTNKDGILTPDQQIHLDTVQKRAADSIFDYLKIKSDDAPFPMVAMATGIGKGQIVRLVIEQQIRDKSEARVLVVAGTKNVLVEQFHQVLSSSRRRIHSQDTQFVSIEDVDDETEESIDNSEYHSEKSVLYSAGNIGEANTNVHVATIQRIQSLMRRGLLDPHDYDLLIVDEVHNIGTKSRKSVIDQFAKICGFTATPYRHSGRMREPSEYGFIVVDSLTLPEAQRDCLLPPLIGMQVDTKEVVDQIPVTNVGTIDYKALEKLLKKSPELRPFIADRVAKIIASGSEKYKTVIAVNFVWEAEEIAHLLRQKGIKVGIAVNKQAAKAIHSEDIPAIDSLERYGLPETDDRSIQVLISPYVASEGFDAPFTEVLVWASPTDSPLRYTQYTGRLARRNPGKRFGIIVDCLYQTNQYSWSYNMGMWMKGDVRQLENGLLWLGPDSEIGAINELLLVKSIRQKSDLRRIQDLQSEEVLDVQEGDFVISFRNIFDHFVGHPDKVREVFEEFKKDYPACVTTRNNCGKLVEVVYKDVNLFYQKVYERSIKRKLHELLPVQESDFPLTQKQIVSSFVGAKLEIDRKISEIFAKFKEDFPESTSLRTNENGRHINVITNNLDIFIDRVISSGIKLKENRDNLLPISEGDFVLTVERIQQEFVGRGQTIRNIFVEFKCEFPDSVAVRRTSSGKLVDVIIDNLDIFLERVTVSGIKKRIDVPEMLPIQDGDFALSKPNITSHFIGTYDNLKHRIRSVFEEFKREYPDCVATRRITSQIIDVVCERQDLFIELILNSGIKKKPDVLKIQEGDFSLSSSNLRLHFREASIEEKIKAVVDEFKRDFPDCVVVRQNGSRLIEVICSQIDAFLERVQQHGIERKDIL